MDTWGDCWSWASCPGSSALSLRTNAKHTRWSARASAIGLLDYGTATSGHLSARAPRIYTATCQGHFVCTAVCQNHGICGARCLGHGLCVASRWSIVPGVVPRYGTASLLGYRRASIAPIRTISFGMLLVSSRRWSRCIPDAKGPSVTSRSAMKCPHHYTAVARLPCLLASAEHPQGGQPTRRG
ncbi:hypothetical protein FVE85_7679 [Porphyridium purpureum]|uniref:Uncharacterized protein n=1 Tax=Porphyridium purpureum TaxID=35688 RepID=A0A5J4Z6A6_PORPP|nr:hypothetical protein FVE85_6976 [Porphyridium purpureum]KAA8500094.1 hypothetical protein FVE85_7679 [Porphyridium purpureum]|eukprot:POR8465..scf295_1